MDKMKGRNYYKELRFRISWNKESNKSFYFILYYFKYKHNRTIIYIPSDPKVQEIF